MKKIVLLVMVLAFTLVSKAQADQVKSEKSATSENIIGDWFGILNANGIQLKLVFHIVASDHGFSSTMDSPDQSAFGIAVTKTEFENAEISLEIASLKVSYKGKLENDSSIVGIFTQMGHSFDLSLKKSSGENIITPKVVYNRPQEPVKPYPYITEDLTFENKEAQINLAGSLTLPSEGEKFPAVILVSGSGPQNRDEELLGHKPFLVLSDYLTRNGIAVLRYDDRGIAKSEGDFATATTYDFAKDVEAAFEYLKTRPEIDAKQIGIIGHSEGGLIAQMVASEHSDLGFIVSMAGPGMRGDQLMLLQKKKIETQMNVPAIAVESNQKIFGKAYELIVTSESNDDELKEQLAAHFKTEYRNAMKEEQVQSMVAQFTTPWFYESLKLDPSTYLSKIKTPVLALNGTKDIQVPYEENLEIIKEQLDKAENSNYTIKSFKGLNHLFQACETGALDEYKKIEQTLSPKVLKYMSKWIVKQIKK